MQPARVYIAGTGVYLPEVVDTAAAVAHGWYDPDEAAASGWTGAAVAGEVPAPEMAVRAATTALARSGHGHGEIGLLLHASNLHQGPDLWPPQSYIQRHTIGGQAPAVEIRQNCNGMLFGIEMSCCFLTASGHAATLVTGADNLGTSLFDRWRYLSGAGTNRLSIAGDSGAAAVLSSQHGFARLLAINSMSVPVLEEVYRSGRAIFPPDATLGRPADIGARLAHYRRHDPGAFEAGKAALAQARTELGRRTLAEADIAADQVTRALHIFAGRDGYIADVLTPLGIDSSRGMLDFGRRVGHLGCCDHVVALDHLWTTGQLGPGDHVLFIGNGGASVACAVAQIIEPAPG
jgi:3-oxoacyl-[acyl-carrier-protein] synthase-3